MSAPSRRKPRLLIADYAATRLGIRVALGARARICAEAGTADAAVELARRKRPDLCLIGFELTGGGLTATRRIREFERGIPIIVLANRADPDDLLAAVDAGASGYLPAEIPGASLARAVSCVLAGEAAIPRSMTPALLRALQTKAPPAGDALTTREAQVLAMLKRGQPTAAIAERLGISPVTVRRHISRTMRKTDAADRRALVRNALRPAAGFHARG